MLPHNAGAEKVRNAIESAGAFEPYPPHDVWPEPDFGLLGADMAHVPALSADSLPPAIMDWSHATAVACAAPVDYVVANLLTAASGWLGNSRRIRATPSWIEPPHLWFACVGSPSTGKTPAIRPFLEASHRLEAEGEDAWAEMLAAHGRDTEHAKAKTDEWKTNIRSALKQGEVAPEMPPDAAMPAPPVRPRVLIADATVQEIGNILSGNPRGLLQIRDELSGWLGSMDQFSGAGSDRAFYLESWNGGPHTIDRVKHAGQPVRVPYSSLAIAGGLQPDKLREALKGADDGLAARFCYVCPNPLPYEDLKIEQDSTAACRLAKLIKGARRLSALSMDQNERNERVPVIVSIDREGFVLLNDIRRDATVRARAAKGLAAGWHGKTPARVLRFALVIEFLCWALADDELDPPSIVSADSVAYAGAYIDYLGGMFERMMAGLKIDKGESEAAMVARQLVLEKPKKLNERALYQRAGFSFLREKECRRNAFQALAEAGFLRPTAHLQKGRRAGDWDVNPLIVNYRP